tara:strand:+ start:1974 stop:2372 length:399 start_codon:yes stop_codon:yes gene_type:complete
VTFEQIRLAIESRMAAWDGVPVAYDSVPNSPALTQAMTAKSSWVRLSINHGDSSAPYKGSEPGIRRTGLVQLQIFTPLNSGSRPAADIADSLVRHFQFYRTDGIEILTASAQRIGPEDDYYRYNLSIPFRAG